MTRPESNARPGWIGDVELLSSLEELRGLTVGVVQLPLRLCWSGPDPESVEWRLDDEQRRARLYEVVLREGSLNDVRTLIDGATLVRIWHELYLPPHVRRVWSRWLNPRVRPDAAPPAAGANRPHRSGTPGGAHPRTRG